MSLEELWEERNYWYKCFKNGNNRLAKRIAKEHLDETNTLIHRSNRNET